MCFYGAWRGSRGISAATFSGLNFFTDLIQVRPFCLAVFGAHWRRVLPTFSVDGEALGCWDLTFL